MISRDQAILERLGALREPAVVACVNLQNFKPLNAVLGHAHGDRLLARIETSLGAIGPCWRTRGDEFVVVVSGSLDDARRSLGAFSWLFYVRLAAVRVWRFTFTDGRRASEVPWQSFEVVCSPRCALVVVGSDPRRALVEAREACDALRSIEDDGATSGFAPRVREPWKATRTLAMPGCPACDAPSPLRVDDDLGWSKERCDACSAEYDRADLLAVLGELEPGA